jgi:hypothetical protein
MKSAFFVWLLVRFVPDWFGIQRKTKRLPQPHHPESSSSQAIS